MPHSGTTREPPTPTTPHPAAARAGLGDTPWYEQRPPPESCESHGEKLASVGR